MDQESDLRRNIFLALVCIRSSDYSALRCIILLDFDNKTAYFTMELGKARLFVLVSAFSQNSHVRF